MSFNLDSEFYCCKCGGKQLFSIPRQNGKQRKAGHLKKMYCFNCKQEVNFAECKPYTYYDRESFLLEFNYNNFDEQQNRKIDFGLFKDKLKKEGMI